VPATAAYGAAEILQITTVTLNGGAIAINADNALHVAAYFGDAPGNGAYSSLDGQRVLRLVAGLDSGFAPYLKIDPVAIADITANGAISALDGTRILQEVVGLSRTEIPPLPSVNTAPVAANDAYTVSEDTVLSIFATGVLTNDTDANGDPLSVWLNATPTHGTLTLNSNGSFTYSPNANFNGTDSFTYRATDGGGDSMVANVAITIQSVNDAPVLGAIGSRSVEEGALLTFTASAIDINSGTLMFSLVNPPAGATIDAATGVFGWTPDHSQAGVYNVTCRVTDGVLKDDEVIQITVDDVPALTFNVSFDDPAGTFSGFYPVITSHILAAGVEWDKFILGDASLKIVVRFATNILTANGASGTSSFVGTHGSFNVFEHCATAEIRTGVDPNGATPDILITVGSAFLINALWFDPDPFSRTAIVPADKTDAMSSFIHELAHAFGFNGFLDSFTGDHPGNFESTYDEQTVFDGTNLFFLGPQAVAQYGGSIPLTFGNYMHVGNNAPRPGSDLIPDLMNGVVVFRGTRYEISPLDVAVLMDVGVPIDPAAELNLNSMLLANSIVNPNGASSGGENNQMSAEVTAPATASTQSLFLALSPPNIAQTPFARSLQDDDSDDDSFLSRSNYCNDEISRRLSSSTGKWWLFLHRRDMTRRV
jgi:VCBS repeat-containing protein